MAVYHVLIDDNPAAGKVIERLRECYRDHYIYHEQDRVLVIRTDDISEKVAQTIGIKGEDKIEGAAGAVFKMNTNYAGYTNGAIWEWLSLDDVSQVR